MANHATLISIITKDSLAGWLEANPRHQRWIESTGFKAEPGSFTLLPAADGGIERVLAAPADSDATWSLAGLSTQLPEGQYQFDVDMDADAATNAQLGWALNSYAFTTYKARSKTPATLIAPHKADQGKVSRLSEAISLSRDLINTPAQDMGPEHLAATAEAIAAKHGAKLRVLRGEQLLDNNYPTIHAVGRASAKAPTLIDMTWGDDNAPKVTLVGKGVCFDTGGLDLKQPASMLTMKKDMGGAAVVLGLAQALMDAKLPIRLRVLVPAVENSVSANAYRPGDIIRTRAGKTVEIGNTDAEGRLILCDALHEADSEAPELLIDCATLTGAARVALGPNLQALFCDDDETAAALQATSMKVGDPMWRMPIWRPYRKHLDGKCAEMNNVAPIAQGGAIFAALFLAEFVSKAKTWVHLDINGSNDATRPGRPEGGEATGLRPLYEYICQRYGAA
ncbi:MAG: leucyl aminopeptidase family protein [Burkholderiales bacterium]|nr:leucyl aminopeptidase family protein [Burkholderiales bacterium]